MNESKKQLTTGAILSYVQMALSIIIGIVYTPVMLRYLGQNEYGLYNTVASTISTLSLLSLGLNSGYVRYFSKYKKNNDKESIDKLNGLYLIIFTIIGVVGLLCGLFLSFNLKLVFDQGLTVKEYETAKVLMILLTINLALSFPMSVFSHIISANEKFIFLKLLGIVKTLAGPLVTLPLLIMGYRSIAMVAVTLTIAVIIDALYLIYVFGKLKQKFVFHGFEKGILKELFVYTGFIALNMIVDQINWNIDKILLGRFKGTEAVAIYSIGYTLYSYYMSFSTSISGVFTPRIHAIVNATVDDPIEQKNKLTELFVKVGRIQFLILGLLSTGVVFFGKSFIFHWAGSGYEESYIVALFLILPSTIPLTQNIGIAIQRAQNNHQFRSIIYVAMAVLNLILSVFLCQRYGAIGSAIGTAISLILGNGLAINIFYHKKCNIDIFVFWKNILQICLGLIIPIVFGSLCITFIDLYSIWKLILSIVIYTIVYCVSVWFLAMNDSEKELIKGLLRKLFKKEKTYDKNNKETTM